ncbi:hypothetical protein QR680_011647 [Steinernema hermaphroditum]|uniref:C-type lectin domain-containing protein n=1 Tax=Steinernema hermaphroditum TaxID=289476 RepID=A0AA39HZ88_9BILA|nr:hypothetical protein QR680_011647 [Steinernema hermaphroditum]
MFELCLLALLYECNSTRTGYLRTFPVGTSLVGIIAKTMSAEKVQDCAQAWFNDSIVAISYDRTLKRCDGFREIHGMTKGDGTVVSYMFTKGSDDVCLIDVSEDFNKIVKHTMIRSALAKLRLDGMIIDMHLTPDNYENYNDGAKWVWVDNSPVTYTNWNSTYGCPFCNDPGRWCTYAMMSTIKIGWYQCDTKTRRPLLCKYEVENLQTIWNAVDH